MKTSLMEGISTILAVFTDEQISLSASIPILLTSRSVAGVIKKALPR
jgi:hypothetical protein